MATMQSPLPLDGLRADRAPDDWRIDDRTREAGRRGLAEARAALDAAARRAAAWEESRRQRAA